MAKAELAAATASLGLKITAEFVPFSKSRNAGEKSPSLNWQVTIAREGRGGAFIVDYSAGCGHCPGYKQSFGRETVEQRERVAWECENGFASAGASWPEFYRKPGAKRIKPEPESVIWSLIQDASVLDAGGFESWAGDLGYDTDSRKAETIYKACIETALKLRALVGDEGLRLLQTAGEDF